MSDTNAEDGNVGLDIKEDSEIFLEFLSESYDHLEESESNILTIEEDTSDLELINAIFRNIHSIKGSAGFLGLTDMQKLSHELETLLDMARKGEITVTQEIIGVCLNAIDVLRKLRENLAIKVDKILGRIADSNSSPKEQPINIQPIIDKILSILSKETNQKKGSVEKQCDTDVPMSESTQADTSQTGKPEGKSGEGYIGEILISDGAISQEQLDKALQKKDRKIGEILVDEGATTPGKIDKALQQQSLQRQSGLQSRTVKVDTNKLDNLVDLVGELVISNTLISGEMESTNNNNGSSKNLSQLNKITKDIQDQVMSMRMVSLKHTFQKMSRLVRDVSKQAGKQIKLQISGEETELDKNVIEEIADPLVHILRNSIDHGIEPENERVDNGKSKEGTVRLSAFHRGGNIVIEIEDDGKGLQKDRILKKAIEKGMIKDQSEINDNQIYNLIFAPGFSTAEKVTNISGRGVGMDVVKRNIEKLRGKVEVTSHEGKGTLFTIKLPLTLAIIDGIVVKVGNMKYIIPTISIEESLRPKQEEINTIKNKGEVINMRGNLFPLVRLHKLYNIQTTKTNPWDAIVIIVESEEGRFSLLVDELLGQQQVVIKSLGERFKNVKGISGGAILGDGKVGLILDVGGIRKASLVCQN
jgi:two-component system chemotaxis sensor kinase CheA